MMPDKNGDFTLEELLNPATLLAKHYAKKLPKYGWAGRKNATEKEYVRLVKEARENALKAPHHYKARALKDKPKEMDKQGMRI